MTWPNTQKRSVPMVVWSLALRDTDVRRSTWGKQRLNSRRPIGLDFEWKTGPDRKEDEEEKTRVVFVEALEGMRSVRSVFDGQSINYQLANRSPVAIASSSSSSSSSSSFKLMDGWTDVDHWWCWYIRARLNSDVRPSICVAPYNIGACRSDA